MKIDMTVTELRERLNLEFVGADGSPTTDEQVTAAFEQAIEQRRSRMEDLLADVLDDAFDILVDAGHATDPDEE